MIDIIINTIQYYLDITHLNLFAGSNIEYTFAGMLFANIIVWSLLISIFKFFYGIIKSFIILALIPIGIIFLSLKHTYYRILKKINKKENYDDK